MCSGHNYQEYVQENLWMGFPLFLSSLPLNIYYVASVAALVGNYIHQRFVHTLNLDSCESVFGWNKGLFRYN